MWRLPQSEQLRPPGHKGREMNDENSQNPVSEKIEKGQIITLSVQGQKIWRPVQISIRYKGSQLQGTSKGTDFASINRNFLLHTLEESVNGLRIHNQKKGIRK